MRTFASGSGAYFRERAYFREHLMGRREDLELMREGLFEAFNSAPDTVKAQVAAQLRAVIKDLAELPAVKDVNPVDDFSAARTRRQARAKVS